MNLSIYLSIYVYSYLSICLSIYLYIHIYPPTYQFNQFTQRTCEPELCVWQQFCGDGLEVESPHRVRSIHLSIYLYIYIHLSIYLSIDSHNVPVNWVTPIHLSINTSIHLYIHPSIDLHNAAVNWNCEYGSSFAVGALRSNRCAGAIDLYLSIYLYIPIHPSIHLSIDSALHNAPVN